MQVVFARDAETARLVSGQIASQMTLKLYVARVSGRMQAQDEADGELQNHRQFCTRPRELRRPIYCIQARPGIFTCSRGAAAAAMTTKKHGENGTAKETVSPTAVEALTFVWPLWYDARRDETLVLCRPVTGRTHQIRRVVHTWHFFDLS